MPPPNLSTPKLMINSLSPTVTLSWIVRTLNLAAMVGSRRTVTSSMPTVPIVTSCLILSTAEANLMSPLSERQVEGNDIMVRLKVALLNGSTQGAHVRAGITFIVEQVTIPYINSASLTGNV